MPGPEQPLDQELKDRLAACGANHTVRGVIIGGVLDQAVRLGGADVRARVVAKLSSPRFVDFFTYPVSDLVLATYHSTMELGGGRPTMRKVGSGLSGPFFQETAAGRLAASLLGGNARRYCAGLPAAYGMLSNFGKRTVVFPTDGRCLFTVIDDPIFPELHAGAIQSAAAMLAGSASASVTFETQGPMNVTYDIRW